MFYRSLYLFSTYFLTFNLTHCTNLLFIIQICSLNIVSFLNLASIVLYNFYIRRFIIIYHINIIKIIIGMKAISAIRLHGQKEGCYSGTIYLLKIISNPPHTALHLQSFNYFIIYKYKTPQRRKLIYVPSS